MDNKSTLIRSSFHTATNSTANYDEVFSELVPVLTQCFGVILLGYIAGRLKIFSEPQAKGLNLYVTRFALPTVFFRAMVTINFSSVCWFFVMAISISKLIGFIMAITFTFLISRRFHLGIAAIVAMFVSQTNDVALAYPILYALFPDLASYVYLFAPVQLVVLNPFAYFLLELERVRLASSELKPLIHSEDVDIDKGQLIDGKSSNSIRSCGRCQQLTQVMFNVLKNPLIFMTLIGIIFNFILKHQLPVYINGLLSVIADSFGATALFSLGYGMVGKMATITQREAYILTTILLTKLLVVPFITRELVVQMMPIALTNETLRYSTFGFLYGTTPTAPPVYLFAAEYQVIPVAIGVGLVLGTFLCVPIMFIFARIIALYNAAPSDYANILSRTVEDISWISIVCCIWTLGVLFLSRKAIRVPNRFTLCHLICVLFACTGLLLGRFVNYYYYGIGGSVNGGKLSQPAHWLNYIQFAIFFFGSTGTRFWTTLIALVLVMERARSLCFVLRYQFHIYIAGFLTPAVVTGILLLTSFGQMVKYIDPIFQYGTNQVAEGICRSQLRRNFNDSGTNVANQAQQSQQTSPSNSITTDSYRITRNSDDSKLLNCGSSQIPQSCDSAKFCNQCEKKQRKECAKILARYCEIHQPSLISSTSATHSIAQQISLGLELDNVHAQGNSKPPHHKHVVFLILILVTMFFGICLCTWRLVHDAPTGVYIVLEFLDGSFHFGQGVILFVLFGLDADLFIAPIKRFLSRWFSHFTSKQFNGSFNKSSHQTTVDKSKINKIVNQFVKFHLKSCSTNIGTEKVIDSIHYEQIFYQYSLERWLIDGGITDSNEETLFYIECLELGNIITCISPMTNESFMDKDTMTTISNTKRLLTFTTYAWGLHNISY
ncbi:unnamed protein product [Schistosoma rodhaini]|uniref:DEP domain-containing protein n=2 Tax=Schistosoma rodhaini TaxID=6188 RepID=A0AA85GJS4_9TREM|nr:unnamed protein product [Schistosoma rodhaini]